MILAGILLLFLLLFASHSTLAINVTCQSNTGYCGSSSTGCASAQQVILQQSAYAQGDTILIAANVTLNKGTQTYYSQFYPVVDQFAGLEIQNSGDFVLTDQPLVTFSVFTEKGYISLPPSLWSNGEFYVPERSIAIALSNGEVESMVWNAVGCSGICSDSECINGTCGIKIPTVSGTNITAVASCGESCRIKVYLAWSGTDRYGNVLRSGNTAFSKLLNWWQFDPLKLLVIASNFFRTFGNPGFNDITSIDVSQG